MYRDCEEQDREWTEEDRVNDLIKTMYAVTFDSRHAIQPDGSIDLSEWERLYRLRKQNKNNRPCYTVNLTVRGQNNHFLDCVSENGTIYKLNVSFHLYWNFKEGDTLRVTVTKGLHCNGWNVEKLYNINGKS